MTNLVPMNNADIVIYYNPSCGGARFRAYYALAPEGCGSFGASPDDARAALRSVRQRFERADPEMRRILIEEADERVREVMQGGGRKQIDAQ